MAIAPSIYHVRYSDWTSGVPHEIVIQPGQVDDSTSLALPGSGKLDYGQFMDRNILMLMEHFANDTPPLTPSEGQLWFHKTENKLRLYDLSSDPSFNGWSSLQQTRYGITFPSTPNVGDFFYNTNTNVFFYWDGTSWDAMLTSTTGSSLFVLKAGDTMTGDLNMGNTFHVTGLATPVAGSDATNKTYVDAADALKVAKAGDTMTGFLVLNANPTTALQAAPKQYVDAADNLKVAKAGDTMTGPLTLNIGSGDANLSLLAGATNLKQLIYGTSPGLIRWTTGDDGTPETGSNTGSNFFIKRYSDAGGSGNQIDVPFQINRATGTVTIGSGVTTIPLTINGNSVTILGNATTSTAALTIEETSGRSKVVAFGNNGNISRWSLGSDATAEVGGNTGSNFFINKADDSGTITPAISIARNTGDIGVYGNVTLNPSGATKFIHNVTNPVAAQDAATKSYVDASIPTLLLGSTVQTYVNITGSRTFNTVYTNSTPRPIFVTINVISLSGSQDANPIVNGAVAGGFTGVLNNARGQGSFIVPAGQTYQVASAGALVLESWYELR